MMKKPTFVNYDNELGIHMVDPYEDEFPEMEVFVKMENETWLYTVDKEVWEPFSDMEKYLDVEHFG